MIKISHKKQKNDGYNWKCGAACLEMIFEYFKIVRTQDDIWNEIKSMRPGSLTQFYACTHDVIRYAINSYNNDCKRKKDICVGYERYSARLPFYL